MLILKYEVALTCLLVYRLDQEDPELLQAYTASSHLQIVLHNHIEYALVVLWSALKGQHATPIIVSLPKHVVPGHPPHALIPTLPIRQQAHSTLAKLILGLTVETPILYHAKVVSTTVPCRCYQRVVVLALHSLNGQGAHQSTQLHLINDALSDGLDSLTGNLYHHVVQSLHCER